MGGVSRRDPEGENSMESIQAKLERNQAKLQGYTDAKSRLERCIEKNFREIECMNDKIQHVEIQIERLVQEAAAKEIQDRTRRELALIRDEECEFLRRLD